MKTLSRNLTILCLFYLSFVYKSTLNITSFLFSMGRVNGELYDALIGGLRIVILSFLSSSSKIFLFFKKLLSEDLPEYLITA